MQPCSCLLFQAGGHTAAPRTHWKPWLKGNDSSSQTTHPPFGRWSDTALTHIISNGYYSTRRREPSSWGRWPLQTISLEINIPAQTQPTTDPKWFPPVLGSYTYLLQCNYHTSCRGGFFFSISYIQKSSLLIINRDDKKRFYFFQEQLSAYSFYSCLFAASKEWFLQHWRTSVPDSSAFKYSSKFAFKTEKVIFLQRQNLQGVTESTSLNCVKIHGFWNAEI